MASTSADALAIIRRGGRLGPELLDSLAAAPVGELFGELVEPLSDSFEAAWIPAYVDVFSEILERVAPPLQAHDLKKRYEVLRTSRPSFEPAQVVTLSRITLGADVAITSTFLAAAMRRWPAARIVFAGPPKNFALFAGNPRVELLEVRYGRSQELRERVAAGLALAPLLSDLGTLVIDPDSRLSQLGLLPLADVNRTLFFESRGYGGEHESLVELTRAFCREALNSDASPWMAPVAVNGVPATDISVSFGVGENTTKRAGDELELELIRKLLHRGHRVLLDSGAPGSEEAERASRIQSACNGPLALWKGSFAAFAGAIARSRLYVGYDSAGQHVAAAAGVSRVTVFAGNSGPRFAARWRPDGPGSSHVVFPGHDTLDRVLAAADSLLR